MLPHLLEVDNCASEILNNYFSNENGNFITTHIVAASTLETLKSRLLKA